MVGDYEDLLDSSMSSLSDKRIALQDEYDKAIEKRDAGIEPLTTSEQDYIDTYEAISNIIKLIYQYTDQNAWNSIEISDIFNTEGIEKTKEELVSMAKSGELTPEILKGYKNLNTAISNSEIFLKDGQTAAEAFCDELYAIADAENKVSGGINPNETPIFSLSENQTKSIDEFESKMKTLGDALSKLQSGSFADGDLTNLIQEFPELQGKSENLESAIKDLINNSLDELYTELGNPPDDLKNDLRSLADNASKVSVPLNQAFSSIEKSYGVLKDFKDAISNNAIDDAILNSVGGLSGTLNDLVAGFHAGVVSADELYTALQSHYDIDLQNYSNALIAKNATSESFYNAIGLGSTEVVEHFSETYKIDLSNCKTYAKAKEEIELQTLHTISKSWSAYYDVQSRTMTKQFYAIKRAAANGDSGAKEQLAYLEKNNIYNRIAEYENAMDELDRITYDGIEVEFEKISNKVSTASKSAKKAAEDAEKSLKEYIDSYMNYMEKSLLAGKIDYRTYCTDVSKFLKDLYDSGKLNAKDYFYYVEKQLEYQKSIYDKVLSAVTRKFDDEISEWQDKIDELNETNKSLQSQLDDYDGAIAGIGDVYDTEIERIQSVIDELKEANDEKKLAIALDKAKFELNKAHSQKVKTYADGQYRYVENDEAIRNAQENYEDAELDKVTSELEDQIDTLNEFKEKWQEIVDEYEKQQNELILIGIFGEDYQQKILENNIADIEAFKEQYINIQEEINSNEELIKSYEEKIEYYEELKKQWEDVASEYEQSIEDQIAAMILGQDWESDILSGRLDTLNNFRNEYIAIQQALADAAWNSANEQIKAAQEAKKAADGVPSQAGNIDGKDGSDNNPNEKYITTAKVVNTLTGNEVYTSNGEGKNEQEAKDNAIKNAQDYINKQANSTIKNNLIVVDIVSKKYASGTRHAKPGINLVGENGTEIYEDNDGNVSIIASPTLIPMEGGEKVYNAGETKPLLKNGNLFPLNIGNINNENLAKLFNIAQNTDWNAWYSKLSESTPQFNVPKPDYSYLNNVVSRNTQQSVTQNINVTIPNITNETGFNNFRREMDNLKQMAYKEIYKR